MGDAAVFELTQAELDRSVHTWIERLERERQFTASEYLEAGRLWNTLQGQGWLVGEPDRTRLLELVQREIPTMVAALDMTPGRAFGLVSSKHDFVLGGILDRRFQYRIKDA